MNATTRAQLVTAQRRVVSALAEIVEAARHLDKSSEAKIAQIAIHHYGEALQVVLSEVLRKPGQPMPLSMWAQVAGKLDPLIQAVREAHGVMNSIDEKWARQFLIDLADATRKVVVNGQNSSLGFVYKYAELMGRRHPDLAKWTKGDVRNLARDVVKEVQSRARRTRLVPLQTAKKRARLSRALSKAKNIGPPGQLGMILWLLEFITLDPSISPVPHPVDARINVQPANPQQHTADKRIG